MRVLVCGSRDFNDYRLLEEVLDRYEITEIIQGEARGADSLARTYGERRGIPVHGFPALWDIYGRAAGPIRNSEMLREGDPELVIAFPKGASRGTYNMIEIARKAGVPVYVAT